MEAGLVRKSLTRIDLVVDLSNIPVIFHSDQGSQYGAETTVDILTELKFERSMSRPGTPTDNGISERFVRTFKDSVVKRYKYSNLEEFQDFATKWLNFYNITRPHFSLKDKSPNEYATSLGLNEVEYLCLNWV
jgi:transposase InsO family protein